MYGLQLHSTSLFIVLCFLIHLLTFFSSFVSGQSTICKMSSSSNSTSSLTGSTSSAPDGSGRTFTPFFPQFGSMSPVLNPDGTLKGVYDVEDHSFIPTSKATRGGPRNSVLGAPTLVNATSSRAPPPPSSMGNTAGGGSMSRALISDGGSILSSTGSMGGGDSMSRALISDGGSILSSTGSMGGGGSMSRALISDGGSILSSTGSMGGGGSMSRGLISDGGSILSSTGSMGGGGSMSRALISDGGSILSSTGSMGGGGSMSRGLISDGGSILSSTGSMGGGGLMSRALFSDGGSIMSSMGSMDGSTEHYRSMMIGLQGSPQVYSMPGSAYPTAAGGHSQTYVQAMNSLSSMSLMNSIYTTTDYQMDLHQQELMMQSQQSSMGRHGGFYFGDASMPTYPLQLPSAQAVSRSGVISSQTGGPPTIGSRSVNAATGYDQPLQHHQNTSQFGGQKLPAIGQPIRDVGSQPTHATTQSTPDPFGMLGLVNVINQTNPDVTTLALGIDLQAMGLDMTSKENLFKTFASPWANEPLKEDQDHFDLPQCYNAIQLPPPNQEMFRRFAMKTLFYIFYSMPKDEAQLYAANELNNRYWFYHKEHKCWFKRIGKPLLQTNAYERGTYDCFDPDKFETVQKENIVIYYEMLERRPSLPQHRV
ncbi:LOW QUALITY PROTEIN: probable NOT transcription complex subunit VIP2 [Brassica napus]|uniref:LOW QUALITY PROTEIN: probable NOT transcription complex subunit VIP2 n=1 Tax=Brassica napus TaxID=3708 RepID=UPI00207AFB60|nr:LOW QUALITY PROTEIN: probable NOT transcription complex subunit VIP2 [Brassica napus]